MPASSIEALRRLRLTLPGTSEKLSHGVPTFFAGTRSVAMFASADNHHGNGLNAVWCKAAPITQELLIAEDPDRDSRPPHGGPSEWVGVGLNSLVDWSVVSDRLQHAHALAIAKPQKRPKRHWRRRTSASDLRPLTSHHLLRADPDPPILHLSPVALDPDRAARRYRELHRQRLAVHRRRRAGRQDRTLVSTTGAVPRQTRPRRAGASRRSHRPTRPGAGGSGSHASHAPRS